MKIQTKIAIQFSIIVASLLSLFSWIIYQQSAMYREEEFMERLKNKALTTASFFIKVDEIDNALLKIIDKNTLTALHDEKVLIFSDKNELLYSSIDEIVINYDAALLDRVREAKYLEFPSGENESLGLVYNLDHQNFVVLASAFDKFGKSKLKNLRKTLILGLIVGILITILLGVFFAGGALKPVNLFISKISTITANNLRQRIEGHESKNEIGLLAAAFNKMLARLEQSFELQKSFVSHASHELRTPLAALKSEVEISLEENLSIEQHKGILQNIRQDINRLINLSNDLLQIVRPFKSPLINFGEVRIDDIIFQAQDELGLSKPEYRVTVKYAQEPEDESSIIVFGNEALLKTTFINLIDNACKYSPMQQAEVIIDFNKTYTIVTIKDEGIGIPKDDLATIFEPFFRSKNALNISGFGIGLSVCNKIIELHKGKISIQSELSKGTKVTVQLPNADNDQTNF
ncbi:cell wall metabolism sensor histidine kinase WalK [Emticicia sp. BO119]|uniref:sensor histidine kinase n=1 Tax=Emticicia sp. BO119 TaxID=2757768 RepID=UPI0015F0D68F|nr:HAMP domain-containing sensor histidine kinase [Emticicia sp. BO119]MBA4852533.1 HAMP domain-containing histidine kinase [Emticicia sp. BO119]